MNTVKCSQNSPKWKKILININSTEHEEQCALFKWVDCWLPMVSALLFAIPMGGHRRIAVAGKLKAEGVKAGVPDIFFALPRNGKHGLFIEMKRVKGGSVRREQKAMIDRLRTAGYQVEICKGFEAARNVLVNYMNMV